MLGKLDFEVIYKICEKVGEGNVNLRLKRIE